MDGTNIDMDMDMDIGTNTSTSTNNNEYIVKNTTIIFNNDFNKSFDSSYKTILSGYNELVIDRFSLYNYPFDHEVLGEFTNFDIVHLNERFNSPLNLYVFPEITVLVLGYRYNNYITFCSNCKITYLSFGYRYYYQKYSTPCFTFGYFFNKPIDLSTVCTNPRQGHGQEPNPCVNLILGSKFNSSIILPNYIKEFVMSDGFDKPFYEISTNNSDINSTDGLFYTQSTCETLECLTTGYSFNQNIDLRKFIKLRVLTTGYKFNSNVLLPKSLSHISFGHEFKKSVILPESLLSIVVNSDNYNLLSYIPNKVNFVRTGYNSNIDLTGLLPNSVKTIHVSKNYKHYDKLVAYYNLPCFESSVIIIKNDSIP